MRFSGKVRAFLGLALSAAFLVGCGSNPSSSGTSSAGGSATKGKLEVASFQGGYGIDFFEQAAKEYGEKHPDLEIKVWGNPRVWEQLRPRFIAGDPPDLTWPGWDLGYYGLIYENQVMPLDEALEGMAADGKTKWKDTFEESLLRLGRHDGKQYMLPYHFNVLGWWYNPDLFAKNGWTPPKTYSELLALCEKIKAKGIAPLTYQGQYPYYMIAGFLLPWASTAGGQAAVDAAQELQPGAWKSPAMLKAAQMIDELRKKGYFQEGAIGMSHTDSQMEFVNDRAAMIPCGTWLYTEMAKVLPANFKMDFMLPPVADGGTGDPTTILIGIEPWIIPSKAKNTAAAIDFYKYMTSVEKAKQFVEQKGTLMAIKGSDQAKMPPHLAVAAKSFREAKTVYSVEYREWYKAFAKETENAMSALLSGEITPEEFCDRCEAGAEKARNDAKLPKHKVQR